MNLFGGIEAGGTKFICIIGTSPDSIVSEKRIPTTTPEETLHRVIEYFKPYTDAGKVSAIGIGSFGPLGLNKDSSTYGYITTTPKEGWVNTNLHGFIQNELKIPVEFDTDVNAAAFGEQYWKEDKRSMDPFLYVTVGTGIGVGAIINGKPLHGLIHAEAGHISIPHDWEKDPFTGACPYHGDCLEGLASGTAIGKRWGQIPETLSNDHPAWDLEAEYLSFAIKNFIYAYSPQQIVLGGGVMQHHGLIELVREKIRKRNKGYIQSNMLEGDIDKYIEHPKLGNKSGALGALAMAIKLAK